MENRNPELVMEFKRILTPPVVRTMQVLYAALSFGVIVFMFVIIYLYTTGVRDQESSSNILIQLSIVHAFMAFSMIPFSFAFYKFLLNKNSGFFSFVPVQKPAGPAADQVVKSPVEYLTMIRTASIIRLAILESVAMFGQVVCYLAVSGGVMHDMPVLWLNSASAVLFIITIIKIFPTEERLMETFQQRILGR